MPVNPQVVKEKNKDSTNNILTRCDAIMWVDVDGTGDPRAKNSTNNAPSVKNDGKINVESLRSDYGFNT